jgi:Xaa-Pro aminopeptidase
MVEAASNPKLVKIRELLSQHGLAAYVVFHNDAHQSEYLAECDERIKYISGFSGSNGICVISQSHALMWTDGRYYLQAEKQLEQGWEMQKMEAGVTTYFEWISQNLKSGEKIGVDPSQIAVAPFRNRSKYFHEKGLEMVTIQQNLVDSVWGADKPAIPQA